MVHFIRVIDSLANQHESVFSLYNQLLLTRPIPQQN